MNSLEKIPEPMVGFVTESITPKPPMVGFADIPTTIPLVVTEGNAPGVINPDKFAYLSIPFSFHAS